MKQISGRLTVHSDQFMSKPLQIELFGKVQAELVFDDEPLAELLTGERTVEPTPADILTLWQRGGVAGEQYADVVTAVLCNHPDLALRLVDSDRAAELLQRAIAAAEDKEDDRGVAVLLNGLAKIHHSSNRLDEAETMYRRAADLWRNTAGGSDESTRETLVNLAKLLKSRGDHRQADSICRRIEIEVLAEKRDTEGLAGFRAKALKSYVDGELSEAEEIYRTLLEINFEPAGTLSHLARVLLMSGREEEARQILDDAWEKRHSAPGYVPPRILFLIILLELLRGNCIAEQVKQLKAALDHPEAFLEWTIEPVLQRYKERLAPEMYEFLESLANVLSEKKSVNDLEAFPLWTRHYETADTHEQIFNLAKNKVLTVNTVACWVNINRG